MKHSLTAAILLIATSLGLMSCAAPSQPPYALAYVEALPRYQGVDPVPPQLVQDFVDHFTHRGDDGWAPAGDKIYASNLYFSDTLLTTESQADVVAYLSRMQQSASAVSLEVLDQQIDGQDVYLVWLMRATFTAASRPVTSQTIGISHLRFNAAGQVVLHQDFWDSAAGFYQHLPVVGNAIRSIHEGFQPEEPRNDL